MPDITNRCEICGKRISFKRRRHHAKYCSSKCENHAHYKRHKEQVKNHQEEKAIIKICEVCGNSFRSVRAKYCSDTCRRKVKALNGLTSTTTKKCIICGKAFEIIVGQFWHRRTKCCSKECSRIRNKQKVEESRQFLKAKKLYEATQEAEKELS